MHTFASNLRFALRSLRKTPGFTLVAGLTLALGIGANTAIFSVVHGVLLRPLPYPDPDRLVRVWPQTRFTGQLLDTFSERAGIFSGLSGFAHQTVSLAGDGPPEELAAGAVSPGHFAVLGVEPALGRGFLPEERRPGADPVAILSHGLWRQRFGGAAEALGQTLILDGVATTIVGVLPAAHEPLGPGWQLWRPLALDPGSEEYRDSAAYHALARLGPGATLAEARAEVRTIAGRLRQEDPSRYGEDQVRGAGVVLLHDAVVGEIRPALLMLLGAVGLVLLIACANVANLLLARAGRRQRELAVRAALGAGRGRLVRQLLQESALLGLGGGALGLLAASWIVAVLAGRLPVDVPRVAALAIDGQVLGFTVLISLASALVFGVAPALRTTRLDVFAALKSGGRGASVDGSRQRLNQGLVVVEIALAMVLVAGAGLLLKSFHELRQVELGFAPEQVLTLRLSPQGGVAEDGTRQTAFYRRVSEHLAALPGVEAVGAINLLPLTPGGLGLDYSTVDHRPPPGTPAPFVNVRLVDGQYFSALGVPLLHGRALDPSDRAAGVDPLASLNVE